MSWQEKLTTAYQIFLGSMDEFEGEHLIAGPIGAESVVSYVERRRNVGMYVDLGAIVNYLVEHGDKTIFVDQRGQIVANIEDRDEFFQTAVDFLPDKVEVRTRFEDGSTLKFEYQEEDYLIEFRV